MARTSSKAEQERDFKNEVREIAAKTAKKVIRRSSIAPDYTEDDPDLETDGMDDLESGFNLETDEEPIVASSGDRFAALRGNESSSESTANDEDVDIFDRFNHNTDFPVKFTIQKNGELLAKKDAPYSWDQVQEEFGGGMYKIIAKNGINGRMLKHESKSVAQPKISEKKLEEKLAAERDSVKDILSTVNAQFSETVSAIQDTNSKQVQLLAEQIKAEKEERRRLEEKQREENMEIKKIQEQAGNSTNTLLATLLPLLVKKDDGGSDKFMTMMLEMQKMNQENQKELQRQMLEMQKETREEARRQQEAVTAMISKMVTELKPTEKKPEFDAITIMKMMQDAESKGMEKMREFMDLADERAERRIEEMKDDKPEKEEGGVIQNTLKMLLPVLVQQGMQKGVTAAPAPEQRLIESHRPQAAQPAIPTNVTAPRKTPTPAPKKAAVATGGGLAKPVGNTPVAQVTPVKAAVVTPVVEVQPKEATINVEAAKELIINVATPILGEAFKEYLTSQTFDAKGCADKTVHALKQHGISPKIAVQCVSAEEIIATCHSYGLQSDETDQHLRAYYENIKASVTA